MQQLHYKTLLLGAIIGIGLTACSNSKGPTIFTAFSPQKTEIHFNNKIADKDSVINEYLYMGGGVGIGDFNNDGLKDIFFSGNQVSSRLYINQGKNHFEDITDSAGVSTDGWATGVSVVDINNDGYDDIYVCRYRDTNLLFINQHDLTFREKSADYGLDDESYSTQATFFDYDKDGRLDMFLVNYRLNGPNPNVVRLKNLSGNSPENDKLYHNEGLKNNHPYFSDVHKKAGIRDNGYGLGVAISDFNNDSWPDIYVTNDFLSNDELWLNDHHGHFTDVISKAMRHQSYSSMGVDAADLNNDLLPDVITLDMAPEANKRQKMQYTFMNYGRYKKERSYGYAPEFSRNMLQLNNGVRNIAGKSMPFFSEIGQYAGIDETYWSWSVLAADFNNDRWKDIYITNGSGREFLNADFINYSISQGNGMRGNPKKDKKLSQKLLDLGYAKSPNYLYLNNGDYTFKNVQDSSGLAKPSISNGAAYADLDNDGDLDLVVNNINKPASIYVNTTIQPDNKNSGKHFLQVKLKGDSTNLDARGAKVFLYDDGQTQMQEENPERGYLSSVDKRLFFGLGNHQKVDSLAVIWPDEKRQVFKNIPADTLLKVSYNASSPPKKDQPEDESLFKDVTKTIGIAYKHIDAPYNDFNAQPLLQHKYSQLGPFITAADVNNDKLTDFFIGGGFNSSGALFTQQPNGKFHYTKFDTTKKYQEDVDCVFFDADNDGDSDLLITYGDTRYSAGSIYYQPRLYLNDGDGNFQLDRHAIPDHVRTISGAVAVADYDGDDYPDVFIGGRVTKMYPESPRSFLLHNKHGRFTDVTEKVAPTLKKAGMITSAIWTDINQDHKPDLVIAGEWMPICLFRNTGAKFQEITKQKGLHGKGLWRSLAACDLDNDGDTDFIAGNLGANNKYNVRPGKPLKLYAADIDKNGIVDPVMGYYIKNENGQRKLYPAFKRDKILHQVPTLNKLFPSNKNYASATLDDIFQTVDDNNILKLSSDELKSVIFENKNGRFVKHPLPAEAQFAPINTIVCNDLNNDGNKDLLLAGNEYQADPRTGRYDASYGYFLRGDGKMNFTPVSPTKSGLILDSEVRDMQVIKSKQRKFVLVAVNNDSLRVFSVNNDSTGSSKH